METGKNALSVKLLWCFADNIPFLQMCFDRESVLVNNLRLL